LEMPYLDYHNELVKNSSNVSISFNINWTISSSYFSYFYFFCQTKICFSNSAKAKFLSGRIKIFCLE
jgi:hypothetical protein